MIKFLIFIFAYTFVGFVVTQTARMMFVDKPQGRVFTKDKDFLAFYGTVFLFWPLSAAIFLIWLVCRGAWLHIKFFIAMSHSPSDEKLVGDKAQSKQLT